MLVVNIINQKPPKAIRCHSWRDSGAVLLRKPIPTDRLLLAASLSHHKRFRRGIWNIAGFINL